MGKLVGKPTGRFTEAGKPTFMTPEGEEVSEKSITIPFKDRFVNVPSIYKGVKRSDDEILGMLSKDRIKPTSTHNTMEEAEKAAKDRSSGLLKMSKGGKITASSRADGIAIRGKTKGRFV